MGINHCWVPGADTNSRTTLLPLVLTEEPIRVLRHSVRALHIYKKEKGTPKPCLPQIGLFPVVSGSQIEGESCASQSSSFMVYFSEKSWAFGILLTELACVGFGEDFLSVLLLFCFCCFFFFVLYCMHCPALPVNYWTAKSFPQVHLPLNKKKRCLKFGCPLLHVGYAGSFYYVAIFPWNNISDSF